MGQRLKLQTNIIMKAAVCLVVLCAFVALSVAEKCTSPTQCTHVSCPENDYEVDCVRNECTCTHTSAACSAKTDCSDSNCKYGLHCIDSKCRCGFGFPTGGK